VNATKAVERFRVMAGDRQVVSQVGTHLLGELADRAGLTSAYSHAVPWTGERAPGHDRGRLLVWAITRIRDRRSTEFALS
jgi:hypothetical protein